MAKILIILQQKSLYLYQNNNLINKFLVAIGKASTPTPTGIFSIINKIKNPYNKALGTRWMQFSDQMHGIHGTNQPNLIGKEISHGCIRMYNKDAEYVYDRVKIGTPVEIVNQKYNPDQYFLYTIEPNDTLHQIAKKFKITVTKLTKLNNITNKDLIYPGQKLKIPNKKL